MLTETEAHILWQAPTLRLVLYVGVTKSTVGMLVVAVVIFPPIGVVEGCITEVDHL